MISVSGTTISMTRGDTLRLTITIKNPDGTDYSPVENDVVRFAAKRYFSDPAVAIHKDVPTDTLLLHFAPADTKTLPVGSYVYDIELTHADGDVDTFISGILILMDEVE